MLKKKTTKSSQVRYDILSFNELAQTDEQKCVISHWMHTQGTPFAKPYEKRAKKILPKVEFGIIADRLQALNSERISVRSADQLSFFPELFDVPFPPPKAPKFTFIDLFAGIGGFRIAMQNCGGKCVFSSEWDEAAQQTYFANYGELPFGDITKEETKACIPSGFDVLCAGFPCQAFSLAGQRKGFDDDYKGRSRGTLFFDVVRICDKHRPKAVFCENVKGLTIHDKGQTFQIIVGALEELGYHVHHQILNSKNFGVPQNRERIYIVGFRKDVDDSQFKFPLPMNKAVKIRDIIEETPVSVKYYLSTQYMETLIRHRARHEAKGHGFGYVIRDLDDVSGAIVCGGMGREGNLIVDKRLEDFTPVTHIKGKVNRDGIRKMTPREWSRLQGYPCDYKLVVSDVHLYKQFGNSVTVPVIQAISSQIAKVLGYE